MRDRRQSERLPSILEGRIELNPQAPKLSCTLRDISATGARVWLPNAVDLPGEFRLDIPVLERSIPVRLMWTEGKTHGVHFLEELQGPAGIGSDAPPSDAQASEQQPAPEGVPKGLSAHTERILDDARQHLAEILDVPVEKIRLTLEIDP
jgi:hypothetical protein